MKITTVIGARPQFIKASFLSKRFADFGITERILHTGQHYDENMSEVFFDELSIPAPAENLGIGGQGHGIQTGQMLAKIESDLVDNPVDAMLVYGDTNSTLAGALAASKLHIPVIHVEAGLRSFDKRMPEEVNRVLTDHVSSLLLCPTKESVKNLEKEGITSGVHLTGDVMQRVLMDLLPEAKKRSKVLERNALKEKRFYLATIHRANNTDDERVLMSLLDTLNALDQTVLIPIHPRTKQKLADIGWAPTGGAVKFIDPVGYLDMLQLTSSAKLVLTDSGGLQKEAVWLSTPCVTLRESTEWVETVESGWNVLAGSDAQKIMSAVDGFNSGPTLQALEIKAFSAQSFMGLFLNNKFNSQE